MRMMNIQQNVSLKTFSTMRLGGTASYVTEISNKQMVAEALAWADERRLPVLMIGGGSNIVWRDEGFPGLLMLNKITGFEVQQEDEENVYVTAGAGELWDDVVARTVAQGLSGIESLSLIPGTAGATPVQNVGAYGQDISQSLATVEAYDRQAKQLVAIPTQDCAFGYRTSRFKTTDRGRFFITAITLHLLKQNPKPPFYNTLQQYFDEHNVHEFTPQIVRDAVVSIRKAKLPNPAELANNGSFFANPVISEGALAQLTAAHGAVPNWPAGQGLVKIPAAWLMEKAGFKDYHDAETGMGTWPSQPLVIVNEHAQTTAQLLQFKQKIVDAVQDKFGIILEQEPELLPQ